MHALRCGIAKPGNSSWCGWLVQPLGLPLRPVLTSYNRPNSGRNCPCCIRATNAALRPTFAVGEFSAVGPEKRCSVGPSWTCRMLLCPSVRDSPQNAGLGCSIVAHVRPVTASTRVFGPESTRVSGPESLHAEPLLLGHRRHPNSEKLVWSPSLNHIPCRYGQRRSPLL